MDDSELEAQQRHDDAMLVRRQQTALVEAAEAVLGECGIQVSDVLGEVSWDDPNVRPFAPQPVSPEAIMRLGRCVLALRRSVRLSLPARARPVDLREALAKCREQRELAPGLFDAWDDLLEAVAAHLVGKPLCALCAADVPHTDSVCVERRERRLRTTLKELADATDAWTTSQRDSDYYRLAQVLKLARSTLSDCG